MDVATNHPQNGALNGARNASGHDQKSVPVKYQSTESTMHASREASVKSIVGAHDISRIANSGGVVLTARSPFVSSLHEEGMKKPRPADSAPPQSLPPQLSPNKYSPVNAARRGPQGQTVENGDSMLSRGVYSLQPGSHESSGSSSTSMSYSGLEQDDSFTRPPLNPALNAVSTRPQYNAQPPSSSTSYPVPGVGNSYSQLPIHAAPFAGSVVQGQGYYRPHQSQYNYSSASPAYNRANWRPTEGAHPGFQYPHQTLQASSQHTAPTQQPNYGASQGQAQHPSASHYFNSQGRSQGTTVGGVTSNYYAPPSHDHRGYSSNGYNPQYISHPPYVPPASHHPHYPSSPFSSSSFGSSVATNPNSSSYSGYDHSQYRYPPTTVGYAPLPTYASTSGSSSSLQSYSPQAGYDHGPVPYHPLPSASTTPPRSNTPQSGYTCDSNPDALLRPESPALQGEPSCDQRMYEQPQAQYTSSSNVTSARTNTSSPSFDTRAESNGSVSIGTRDRHQFADSDEELLVKTLDSMQLKANIRTERPIPGNPSEHRLPINYSQHPACTRKHSDDSESMALLSGLSSTECFEDKTHVHVPSSSIEILEHPLDCEFARNSCVELTCKARVLNSDGTELDYLWYKDGEPLVGEISSDFMLEGAGEGDEGSYFCVVSHPSGESSEQTRPAQLTLRSGNDPRAPVLTQQPEAYIEAIKAEPLALTIVAKGENPMSYKWYKGAQELKYCTGNTLSVTSASALDNGQYCCTVSNTYGSVLSDIVQVKVVLQRTALPPITQYSSSRKRHSSNPDDKAPTDRLLRQLARPVARQTKNWGRLALYLGLLPTDAANSQHYQASLEEQAYHLLREWRNRQHGTAYALRTILTQAGISLDDPTQRAVTQSPISSSSQPASLSISSQPRDVNVVYGQEARLEVKTEKPDHSAKYQWFKNGRPLAGKTEKQLTIASTVDSDQGSYRCQISMPEGSVLSHTATIKVVSVAPQQQKFTDAHKSKFPKDDREKSYKTQHGSSMYGLTGRGVDDDVEPRPQPVSIKQTLLTRASSTRARESEQLHITEHPQSQEVPLGSSATLSCRASGSNDVHYMWYMNGLSLPEDTTQDYSIASMTEEDEGMYSCEVSSDTHSLMSHMATLSLTK